MYLKGFRDKFIHENILNNLGEQCISLDSLINEILDFKRSKISIEVDD